MTTTVQSARFPRLLSALALAGSVLALAPLPAHAAQPGNYVVRLSTPLTAPKSAVIGEILWKCAGDQCLAADAGSRPVIMCQRLAHKLGEVAEFRSTTGALTAEDLAKCNAH
jgi:hypothetical protein